jgi:hypothetical protein
MKPQPRTVGLFYPTSTAAQQMDEALRGTRWDETVQDADEARRMRAYMRFAERYNGGPVKGLCATCAFRPGTEANSSARVLEMIETSMLLGGRFMCHAGMPVNPANGCIEEDASCHAPCRGFEALRGRVA